jgi:pimeloyl-ACP methyl ester carboxylesterase
MPRRTTLLPTLLSGALGVIGGVIGAAWYVSTRVSPQRPRTFQDGYTFTPWELGVPHERVELFAADGLRLTGWWLPHSATAPTIICCHGHSGSKADNLGIGTNLWRAGYNVLLFDFRGRGDADPWPHTLISREVDDLLAAVAYARQRSPQAPIGVVGYSMGAAVAILAAAREPAIAALVADSSFTAGADVVAHGVRSTLRIPPRPLVLAADEVVSRRHGYRFSQARPIDAISKIAPRPVLIIHGANDSITPASHAHALYAAAGEPRQLWVAPEVEHCGAYFADRPAYCRRVIGFFDQYLGSI